MRESLVRCSDAAISPTAHDPSLLPPMLQVWAVRENLVELALGTAVQRLSSPAFYGLTALLVAAAFGISIFVPSIYVSLTSLVWIEGCCSAACHGLLHLPGYLPQGVLFSLSAASIPHSALPTAAPLHAALTAAVPLCDSLMCRPCWRWLAPPLVSPSHTSSQPPW